MKATIYTPTGSRIEIDGNAAEIASIIQATTSGKPVPTVSALPTPVAKSTATGRSPRSPEARAKQGERMREIWAAKKAARDQKG